MGLQEEDKQMQSYEGEVHIRFPFDSEVHKARIQGIVKTGEAILTLDNGEVHKFNVAQLARYVVQGNIWR